MPRSELHAVQLPRALSCEAMQLKRKSAQKNSQLERRRGTFVLHPVFCSESHTCCFFIKGGGKLQVPISDISLFPLNRKRAVDWMILSNKNLEGKVFSILFSTASLKWMASHGFFSFKTQCNTHSRSRTCYTHLQCNNRFGSKPMKPKHNQKPVYNQCLMLPRKKHRHSRQWLTLYWCLAWTCGMGRNEHIS